MSNLIDVLYKPEGGREATIIATNKGWADSSKDLDDTELLSEFSPGGGFLKHLADNGITGTGIPVLKTFGYKPPNEITSYGDSDTGGYDSTDVYALTKAKTDNTAVAITFTATKGDTITNLSVGLDPDAIAEIAVYETTGTLPGKFVAKARVENKSAGVDWGVADVNIELTDGKTYGIVVHSISGQILEFSATNGIDKYSVVDGTFPDDLGGVDGTNSDWNVAAYAVVADYTGL